MKLDISLFSAEDTVLHLTGEKGVSNKMRVYEALSKMHDALEMARCHSLVRQAVIMMGVLGA